MFLPLNISCKNCNFPQTCLCNACCRTTTKNVICSEETRACALPPMINLSTEERIALMEASMAIKKTTGHRGPKYRKIFFIKDKNNCERIHPDCTLCMCTKKRTKYGKGKKRQRPSLSDEDITSDTEAHQASSSHTCSVHAPSH